MTIAAEVSKTTRDFVGAARHLLIDGKWVEAASGKTFVTTDPATEQEITQVAHGEAEDIDRAVAAARRAFEEGPGGLSPRRPGARSSGGWPTCWSGTPTSSPNSRRWTTASR